MRGSGSGPGASNKLGRDRSQRLAAVGIQQNYLNSRKARADNLHQLLGVEVRQAAIQEEYLPVPVLQFDQSFGAAPGLVHGTPSIIQALENLFPQKRAGTGDEHTTTGGRGENGKRGCRHSPDFNACR